MEITIGAFNAETRQVPVTFVHNGVTFERPVNAETDSKGAYDADATAVVVAAVADGITIKIDRQMITNETGKAPDPQPVETDPTSSADSAGTTDASAPSTDQDSSTASTSTAKS